jgi:hypothetical protein
MNYQFRYLASLLLVTTGLLTSQDLWAGMENCRFALHWQTKFTATKTINRLCDDPATATIEPNYSPNWNSNTSTPSPLPCYNYTTSGPVGAGQVYLVVGRAGLEGVAGVSFGVHYKNGTHAGIDPAFITFTPCADGLAFPNNDGSHGDFPQQNGGIRLTWNTGNGCPTATQQVIGTGGAHIVVGSFYIYAYGPDDIEITGNNNLQGNVPELAIASCAGVTTDLYQIWGPSVYLGLTGRVDIGGGYGYNACGLQDPVGPSTWGRLKSKYRTQ